MHLKSWQWLLATIVAIVGIAAHAMPWMRAMEEALGLQALFAWRGPVTPPGEAVIIALDQQSAHRLGLPEDLAQWPRSLHAQLLETCQRAGARVIVLDVPLGEAADAQGDRQLVRALAAADNVILTAHPKHLKGGDAAGAGLASDQWDRPLPALAAAAQVTPFILPRMPARVDAFRLFLPMPDKQPNLPTAVLDLYAHREPSILLGPMDGSIKAWIYAASIAHEMRDSPYVHTWLRIPSHASTTSRGSIPPAQQDHVMINVLLGLHDSSDVRYLNFYGPTRTLTTIPAYRLLEAQHLPMLAGKAVFIGRSEPEPSDQHDGYMTVFSRPDGLDLSGVEIAATGFVNLLHGTSLKPLPGPGILAALALYGLATAWVVSSVPPLAALPIALVMAAAWLAVTFVVFRHAIWLPWLIPVLLQTPLALVGALFGQFWENGRERQRMQQAFSRYLPSHVVDQLVQHKEQVGEEGQLVFGVCLASDAGSYTSLAEGMAPHDLHELMNQYYQTLFGPVRRHGGIISDVVGDAMLALWPALNTEREARRAACTAALEIIKRIERFGLLHDHVLSTRIGLHAGELVLGNVGAVDHYEYRPVGDIVNTGNRIEGLNKLLGTRILASLEVAAGLEEFIWRPLGRFQLAGKRNPVEIHELMGDLNEFNDLALMTLRDAFGEALATFQRGDFAGAQTLWLRIKQSHPEDQPTRFYLNECARYLDQPVGSDGQDMIIVCEK